MSHTSTLSFDELLEWEEKSSFRHECINGHWYPMADETPVHAHVAMNIATAIHHRLRRRVCRGTDRHLRVMPSDSAKTWLCPDMMIVRPPHQFHPYYRELLMNPAAIFEVVTPETELLDRTNKFDAYKAIPDFSDYVLIDTERVRVEHFTRLEPGLWSHRVHTGLNETLELDNLDFALSVAEIYEDVTAVIRGHSRELHPASHF